MGKILKRKRSQWIKIFLVFCGFFALTNYIGMACAQNLNMNDSDQACTPTIKVTMSAASSHETPYCTLNTSFSNPITVSGQATFNILQSNSWGFGAEVLGGPIAFAEVLVLNNSGQIVQCTETDASGNYSFNVDRNQTYRVQVNSRSLNSKVQASVLNNPTNDQYYSVTSNPFTTPNTATYAGPNLSAPAIASAVGGAFNILYNIFRANESLRYYACGNTTGCSSFTVAPKVIAYWTKGFNPYVYFGGSATSGLSFYIPGSDRLYILGGINGDVDNSDSDHFDDAVISHEYGHFIEDKFARTDSPGGSHDGNHVLDPRLTWGEGWANFFSSAVRGNKIYRDCYGTSGGTTGCYFNYDIDRNLNFGSSLDIPSQLGEGNFREFAVSRTLWDSIDPVRNLASSTFEGAAGGALDNNTSDNIAQPFSNFWATFKNFSSSSLHFRNVGLFLQLDSDNVINSSSILSNEGIRPTTQDYAQPLPKITGSGCAGTSISILAQDIASCNIGGQTVCVRGNLHHCCSNQFASNDFYQVYYDGSFSQVSLLRTSGTAELDLYLYKESYTFGNQCDIAARSTIGTQTNKTIDFSGLPIGNYILNVNVYTGNGNPTAASNYQLFVNGNQVCP